MENIESIDIDIVRRRKHIDYESYRDYKFKKPLIGSSSNIKNP